MEPSENVIVERNHRTIKAIAERGGISPAEAVFWYNMSPKSGLFEKTVSQRAVFNDHWRHPKVKPVAKQANTCLNPYQLEKRFGLSRLTPVARRNGEEEELLDCNYRTMWRS